MSVVLLSGYFYVLPLKEKVPYLVMADAYTGTSTVARLIGDFNQQQHHHERSQSIAATSRTSCLRANPTTMR